MERLSAPAKVTVVEKREAVLERVKRRFSHVPPDVSLADELIAERRVEARREAKE